MEGSMSTQPQQLAEARDFLEELIVSPPQLPYEPSLLPKLFEATRENSTASIQDLTGLIEHSQKLAARVLTLANSACYALSSSVSSIGRAVSLLGFKEVRSLVVMIGAAAVIERGKRTPGFTGRQLWEHQLRTASIAKALTAALHGAARPAGAGPCVGFDPDEAYAAGLLHDIGKAFLAIGRPVVWAKIAQLRQERRCDFSEAETAYWGMDHGLIGAQVLHYWHLPLALTDAINWHHVTAVARTFQEEARLLAAANLLAHKGLAADGSLPPGALELLPQGAREQELSAAVWGALASSRAVIFAGMVG